MVVIGNNHGPNNLPSLQYAENDAKNVYDTLSQLGGFENAKLLLGKDVETLRGELESVKNQIRMLKRSETKKQIDLLVYYSGHSDQNGLQVNGKVLPILELKDIIKNSHADVRMGILDGCNTGTVIASKGGSPATPFAIDVFDQANVSGEVFISSSTALEKSHESSEVKGSFFTYYLVTALKGDADFNHDGSISLSEAYRYAYDHTLVKTSTLEIGAQHPTYTFSLKGQGEVILTTLRRNFAYLVIPPSQEGKYYIYNTKGGYMISELEKKMGETKKLALGSGSYMIRKFKDGELLQKKVTLKPNQSHHIEWASAASLNQTEKENQRSISYNPFEIERKTKKRKNTQVISELGPQNVLLRRGELIRLRLLETLNSKKVNVGDKVLFESSEDIHVGNRVVISAGSPAIGEIIFSKSRRGLARGEIALAVRYVKAVDGSNIPISTVIARKGKGKTYDPAFASYNQHYRQQDHHFFEDSFRYNKLPNQELSEQEAIGRFVSLGLAVGITAAMWGTNAKMKAGTLINAFVAEDMKIIAP